VAAALIGGAALPWTVGRILRNQRLLTAGLEERAARAERERGLRARAAVVAERSRVARELHDVVAHGISVLAIQAAGAHDIAERDPQRAAQTASLIETVGSEALAELERLLGPSGGEVAAADPQPSLARVDGLARRAREGGLPVDLQVEGTPAALPAGVDLAAYRIVQEALANTSKHAGDARARIVVRYGPSEVEVEVSDDGHGRNGHRAGPRSGGHGLIGMRERAALYGGSVDAGRRAGGGFRVRASLPIGRA
jgi:signal transduction histidine kinase